MFASRFFRPFAFATATRSFTTSIPTRARTSAVRPIQTFSRNGNIRPGSDTWRESFRNAQQTRQYRRSFNHQRFQTSRSWLQRWAARPTFYYEIGGIALVCGGYYVANLEAVPISGRKRFNVVSKETEVMMGRGTYQAIMQQFRGHLMPHYTKEHQMVQRVLNRLIPHSGLQDQAWEIHVIDSAEENAFVIPGGKVFVFRGMLNICRDEEGVAAVLGHEIAHSVAHHSAEKMSLAYILLPLAVVGSLFGGVDPRISDTVLQFLFDLPASRRQEAEADFIGLLMMAESCYDPAAAAHLWDRMEKAERVHVPAFLTTHPSNHDRLKKIREWLPQAEDKRQQSGCAATSGFVDDFRQTVDMPQWR